MLTALSPGFEIMIYHLLAWSFDGMTQFAQILHSPMIKKSVTVLNLRGLEFQEALVGVFCTYCPASGKILCYCQVCSVKTVVYTVQVP